MTVEYWQLALGAFAVMAVCICLTTYVIAKPTYNHGYVQAVEDMHSALITVHVVADRMRREGKGVDWRRLLDGLRVLPLTVYRQRDQKHFAFVDAAEAIVRSAIEDKAKDA